MTSNDKKFSAISAFVSDLGTIFSVKQRSLKLYCKLLNQTKSEHKKAISKHIDIFTQFCTDNKEAINDKDYKKLVTTKLLYSDRVFIDILYVFNKSDVETQNIIWQHILTISALVYPEGGAITVLAENKPAKNYMNNVVEKISSQIDPKDNPITAALKIMQSGALEDIFSSMSKGLADNEIDLDGIIKSIGGMSSKIKDNTDSNPNISGILNGIMGNVAGLLSKTNNKNNEDEDNDEDNDGDNNELPPSLDLAGMAGMVGKFLSGLNVPQSDREDSTPTIIEE